MSETMKLWRVETGGATYWILGNEGTPAEMQAAIEDVEGVTFGEEAWDPLTDSDIAEVVEEEARRLRVRTEGESDIDMWTAAQETREGEHLSYASNRVVACSEWP